MPLVQDKVEQQAIVPLQGLPDSTHVLASAAVGATIDVTIGTATAAAILRLRIISLRDIPMNCGDIEEEPSSK